MVTNIKSHEGEYHSDVSQGSTPILIPMGLWIIVLCAALNSCNLGYDIGVSTDASKIS